MSERKFASTTINDSEDKLGLTPEQVSQLLADANTSLAKTKGFTQIGDINFEDGLIFTSLIKLLDAGNDGDEMAGVSGIAGDNKEDPAFWAGGTYDQAIGGTAKAIIRHDGSVKFTDGEFRGIIKAEGGELGILQVEENGNVTIFDPDTLVPRLVFSANNLPDLQDLLDGTSSTGNVNIGAGSTATSQTLSGTANVLIADGNATMTECTITINASGRAQSNGMSSDATAKLWLYRNGVQFREIGSAKVLFTGTGYENQSDTFTISSRDLKLGGAGTYTFRLVTSQNGDVYGRQATSTAFRFDFNATVQGVKRQQYGLNGMMFFYSNNHFYYTEEDGLNLRGGNLPGVLAKGRIASSGSRFASKAWGRHNSTASISKPSGAGSYRVPVNCPNGDYDVNISPRTANRIFYIGETTSTYFIVYFRDHNGNAQDSEFSYTLVGDNY